MEHRAIDARQALDRSMAELRDLPNSFLREAVTD